MEPADRPHFGALLRQYRLGAGITQHELAERAKLSVEAISTLERGARTRPHRETVVLLVRALDLSPEHEALLQTSVPLEHAPRRRERNDTLNRSLLRIVRPGTLLQKNNLPQQLTCLIQRDQEIAQIIAFVREHRFVTIVGAGGVGKTRVAVQTGLELLDGCPDGVWLVDLAPLEDQTLVVNAVTAPLQLPSTMGSPLHVLVAYLKTRRLLLILDNCEHLIAEVRRIAAAITLECPQTRVLATSREALNIPGEIVYRLPSLAVPPDSCRAPNDALMYGAVALFVDRARTVDDNFALTGENAPNVTEICRRLDGIPLAIELAAARAKVLSPRQISQRLDQRFRLLTCGHPRALPRHQTMTALIDWSYDLLTPREQEFFESLSVFAGGCTLDAVSAVCAADGEDEVDVIDLIMSMVTKSLLVAELDGSEQRYRLLESFRQYARKKFIVRGKQEQIARRHALFYVELAERLECAWEIMPDREWLPQVAVELENWRTALEWSLAKRGDINLGQRLAAVRAVMWRSFTLAEGRRWVRAAIDLVDERTPPTLIAQLEHAEAEGARRFGEFKAALAGAERALLHFRELGDSVKIAETQGLAGMMLSILGRPTEAVPLLREALDAANIAGDSRIRATSLFQLGLARMALGDVTGAQAFLGEALALSQVLGAALLGASVKLAIAQNEYIGGSPESAAGLIDDVIADYRSLNSAAIVPSIAHALADKAAYLVALGRYEEARMQAKEALILAVDLQRVFVIVRSIQHLTVATVLWSHVQGVRTNAGHETAARILGFVETRLMVSGALEDLGYEHYQSVLSILRDAIGTDEVTRLMGSGAQMSENEAIAHAHALD